MRLFLRFLGAPTIAFLSLAVVKTNRQIGMRMYPKITFRILTCSLSPAVSKNDSFNALWVCFEIRRPNSSWLLCLLLFPNQLPRGVSLFPKKTFQIQTCSLFPAVSKNDSCPVTMSLLLKCASHRPMASLSPASNKGSKSQLMRLSPKRTQSQLCVLRFLCSSNINTTLIWPKLQQGLPDLTRCVSVRMNSLYRTKWLGTARMSLRAWKRYVQ
jgi:hypothetical protein